MSAEIEGTGPFPRELSTIHRLLQQILSLVLSRLKADDPIVDKITERLHEQITAVLTPSFPLSLHQHSGAYFLGTLPLPNSFVLRKLFEASRCSGVYFENGVSMEELREFLREVAYCLQHGVPPFPAEDQTRCYHWISNQAARLDASVDHLVSA